MSKTKPIGVRFDEEKCEKIREVTGLTSYQSIVNYLLDNYRYLPEFLVIESKSEKGVDVINGFGKIIEEKPYPKKSSNIDALKKDYPTYSEKESKPSLDQLKQIEEITKRPKPSMLSGKQWKAMQEQEINKILNNGL